MQMWADILTQEMRSLQRYGGGEERLKAIRGMLPPPPPSSASSTSRRQEESSYYADGDAAAASLAQERDGGLTAMIWGYAAHHSFADDMQLVKTLGECA